MLDLILITCPLLVGQVCMQAGAGGSGPGSRGRRHDCKCRRRQARPCSCCWQPSICWEACSSIKSATASRWEISPRKEAEPGSRIPGLVKSCLTFSSVRLGWGVWRWFHRSQQLPYFNSGCRQFMLRALVSELNKAQNSNVFILGLWKSCCTGTKTFADIILHWACLHHWVEERRQTSNEEYVSLGTAAGSPMTRECMVG